MATGLVPVVYWVPGPFPGPTPVQPDMRGKPFLRHSPDLISLPGLACEPGAGLIRNLPLIPAMSTVNPIVRLLNESI